LSIQNLSSAEIIKFHNSANTTSSQETSSIFGEDGFTFGDIIDIINPLQHIPIISSIYRKITGDVIAPSMQIAGDALFGGPIGAAVSIAKEAIKSQFFPDDAEQDQTTINPATVANNSTQPALKTISVNDYSPASRLSINPTIHNIAQQSAKPAFKYPSGSIGDALANAAVRSNPNNAAEKYAEVISSTNSPEHNIDITIGSIVGAG
jgi:hypothetical protein